MELTENTDDHRDDVQTEAVASHMDVVPARTWVATALLLVAVFMELMDVTMANVAVPSIQRELGASDSQVQWVIAGYALAFAVTLLTGGRLGDIYGRRRIFVIGLASFLLASFACGVAPNPAMLAAARVFQGITAAVMLPQVLASINVWFVGKQRAAAFGLFGAVAGVGGLSAPLIGGSLIHADLFGLGWRPIFLINIPIGLATLVGALFLVDESRSPRPLRLDPAGVLVAALAVLLLVFPIIQGREAGWPPWTWAMLVLVVPALAVLVRLQRAKLARDGSPLIDLSLFGSRRFSAGLLVTLSFFAGVTSIAFILMIYLQSGLGYTAFRAGLALAPLALGVVAGSGLSINLSKRLGSRVLLLGSLAAAGAVVWLSRVIGERAADLDIGAMSAPVFTLGLGIGLVVAPLADIMLSDISEEHSGSAAGLQSTMVQVGNAVGVAALGMIFFRVSATSTLAQSMSRTLTSVTATFTITALLTLLLPRATGPRAARRKRPSPGRARSPS